MADQIAVIRDGHLQQVGTPAEIYGHPTNLFVATFCGSPPMNVLDGEIVDGQFRHDRGAIPLPAAPRPGPAKLGFRPEHAGLSAVGTQGTFQAEIYVVEPLGNETLVTIKVGETLVNLRAAAGFERPIGEACAVRPEPDHLHLFDTDTGAALGDARASQPAATGATA